MILISHRGNLNGPVPQRENDPEYVDQALNLGVDVEVDVRCINGEWYLGHDKPEYKINLQWIEDRAYKLWVHCKNIEALTTLKSLNSELNYFWHQTDKATLTSRGYIWAYPGEQPMTQSIAVMPEYYNDDVTQCIGVCSDYVVKYEEIFIKD